MHIDYGLCQECHWHLTTNRGNTDVVKKQVAYVITTVLSVFLTRNSQSCLRPIVLVMCSNRPSQWSRGLSRGSSAARLLGLRVRVPPGAWIYVCCECSVLSGRGICDELITRPEESYRVWCVWVWSRSPARRGHEPQSDRTATRKKKVSVLYPKILLSNFLVRNSWLGSVVQTPGSDSIQKNLVPATSKIIHTTWLKNSCGMSNTTIFIGNVLNC
jgi:hypothetical protein